MIPRDHHGSGHRVHSHERWRRSLGAERASASRNAPDSVAHNDDAEPVAKPGIAAATGIYEHAIEWRMTGVHFTAAEADRIRNMARRGYDGTTIAAALGRPAQAIRQKAVQLGVQLRPHAVKDRRIRVRPETYSVLVREAHRLHTTPNRLGRLIVEMVVADNLFNAVLAGLPRSMQKR